MSNFQMARLFALLIFVSALLGGSILGMNQEIDICKSLAIGWFSEQNARDYMEDYTIMKTPLDGTNTNTALLGVCDGHAGSRAAGIAGRRLPELYAQQLAPIVANLTLNDGLKGCLESSDDEGELAAIQAVEKAMITDHHINQIIAKIFEEIESEIVETSAATTPCSQHSEESEKARSTTSDDSESQEQDTSGSTAVTAFLWRTANTTNVVVTNLGDSRCIVSRWNGSLKFTTNDHKPNTQSERERIFQAGSTVTRDVVIEKSARGNTSPTYCSANLIFNPDGTVEYDACKNLSKRSYGHYKALLDNHTPNYLFTRKELPTAEDGIMNRTLLWPARVGGYAVSRAFGDKLAKAEGYPIIAEPEVFSPFSLDDGDFLILASDGLWDMISNNEAARLTCQIFSTASTTDCFTSEMRHLLCNQAATKLAQIAIDRGSHDNISIIVVLYTAQPEQRSLMIGCAARSPEPCSPNLEDDSWVRL